ncbi:hypothetical protein LAZ40_02380 [Cereibacter sphaeroides]|uniref:hypothetical protein n=1 Tax=Cereibacter sphaeroides TaxID=1063 RepID=UPI001F1F42A9|nr:hypothetical protein [Cereibacter sphaeroides]MCE6957905.1 hypothetical protein [Cereibacter sphaeroides]MCE6971747.1 hypothetical protein [Cereibacter sphaeroides]
MTSFLDTCLAGLGPVDDDRAGLRACVRLIEAHADLARTAIDFPADALPDVTLNVAIAAIDLLRVQEPLSDAGLIAMGFSAQSAGSDSFFGRRLEVDAVERRLGHPYDRDQETDVAGFVGAIAADIGLLSPNALREIRDRAPFEGPVGPAALRVAVNAVRLAIHINPTLTEAELAERAAARLRTAAPQEATP